MVIKFFMNVAPHYRWPLWSLLLNNDKFEAHFFYGDIINGSQSIDFENSEFSAKNKQLHKVKNYWLKREILIWQTGVISECLNNKFDFAVFTSEMSRPSTWIAAAICRIRGIKVVYWAHGLYGNEKGLKLILKKIFFRLADKFLIYERRGKEILIKHGFKPDNLYVFFNSLDYEPHKLLRQKLIGFKKKEAFPFLSNCFLPVVIFIGRLNKVKKLDMLIEAVNKINEASTKVNLVIIGDGPERKKLENIGKTGLENRWLYFTGACFDEEVIGKYLSASDLCVSPGNVGLTAIHSLSFGTPVGTHDNMFNQMPEAGAIIDGYNGFFFKENDVEDLKNRIENWINIADRDLVRENSYKIIDKYYNPYYQLKVLISLMYGEKPEM